MKKEHQHFVKEIDYNNQPWLTDLIFGLKGSSQHGHLTLSGSSVVFLRDGQGNVIIH